MKVIFTLREKDLHIIFFIILALVFSLALLIRLLIFLNIRFFPPTTDVLYHSLLTKMVMEQKTLFLSWEKGEAVSYPPLFAALSALLSTSLGVPNFRGVWILVFILLCFQVFIAYLLGGTIGGKRLGLASAFFFGIGLFPWTPFLYGGMYANILGQDIMLFLLYFIHSTRLSSRRTVIVSGITFALLVMAHTISLVSFLFTFFWYIVLRASRKEDLNIKSGAAFLGLGFIFSLPWLVHISPSLSFEIPHPIESVLGPTKGLGMVYYRYRLLPIFSLLALVPLLKKRGEDMLFLLWALSIIACMATSWGNRFGMELYVPLNFLAACGLVFAGEKGWDMAKKRNPASIVYLILVFYLIIHSVDNLAYQPSRFVTFDVDEGNFEALQWIRKETPKDSIFYASTVASYVGYIEVYAERKVINYIIQSSAEGNVDFQPEEEQKMLSAIEGPETFGSEQFCDALLGLNVSYIYVFNKNGTTEWRNALTGESIYYKKDELLSKKPDLYELIYENEFVRIYKIIKKK